MAQYFIVSCPENCRRNIQLLCLGHESISLCNNSQIVRKFTHILALRLSLEVYLTFKFVNNMIASIFLCSVCMVIAVFSLSD